MPTEADFLRAMAAVPFDDLPRLQYADWLDDQGDARAEWVRLEVTVCPQFRHAQGWDRFVELSATLPPAWLAAAGWYRWPLLVAQMGRRRDEKHLFALREAIPGEKEFSVQRGSYLERMNSIGVCLYFKAGNDTETLSQLVFLGPGHRYDTAYPGCLPGALGLTYTRREAEAAFGPGISDVRGNRTEIVRTQSWRQGIYVEYHDDGSHLLNRPISHLIVMLPGVLPTHPRD